MRIGIIGGSGLDDPKIINKPREKIVNTKYGKPSSSLTIGKIAKTEVVILARHGKSHNIPPSEINYLANIYSLKNEGVDKIIATTAVGSLQEKIKPGYLVFPNQFIDFTKKRRSTFFDKELKHTPMSEPFDKNLRSLLSKTCKELNFPYRNKATIITIEGPRFSTRSESHMFRSWGADLINMSTCPEVILANELSLPYQTVAMSTDYDCWKKEEEPVTFEMILKTMKKNSEKVKKLLIAFIEKLK